MKDVRTTNPGSSGKPRNKCKKRCPSMPFVKTTVSLITNKEKVKVLSFISFSETKDKNFEPRSTMNVLRKLFCCW